MNRIALLTLGLALASCAGTGAVLNPTIARLDEAKTAAVAGDDTTLSAAPVTCARSAPGCAQLHATRAGACRRTGAFDCAVDEYRAALAAVQVRPDPAASPDTLRLALLESAHARRDAARGSAAGRANRSLLDEATAAQAAPGTRTAGYYYAANAALFDALQSSPPGGCPEIGRARDELSRADTDGTPFAVNGQVLARAIDNASTARRCAA